MKNSFGTRVAHWAIGALLCAGVARAAEQEAVFPLFLEDQYARDIPVLVGAPASVAGTDPLLEDLPLSTALLPWAERPLISSLRGKAVTRAGRRWIPFRALTAAGLTARFDERTLEVRIYVPTGLRKQSSISVVRPFEFTDLSSLVTPAPLSAFVNVNVGQDFTYGSAVTAPDARQALRSELDGAVNYRSFVLEGTGSFTESAPGGAWRRGDFRLVKDQPDRAVRYSVGDLEFPVTGFQRFRPMAGASAVTEFGLQPYRIFTPVGRQEITLKSRSTVRIYMNGQLLQTLELPAGRHSLRDFPFSSGINDILIEITDDVGRTETIRVPYFASDFLLSRGTHQLTYAAGAATRDDALEGRSYDTGRMTFLLSHRYGFTEHFTAGAFAEGDRAQKIAGAPLTLATRFGSWTFEPALSQGELYGTGPAARFGYQYVDYQGASRSQRNLAFSAEARAPGFAALDEVGDLDHARYDFGAGYGQELFNRTSGSLSATYRWAPGAGQTSTTVSAGLARAWALGLDTSLLFTHAREAAGAIRNSVFFLLTWTLPEKGHYFTATGNSENDYGRVQWNYNPTANNLVGGFNSTVGVERDSGEKKADAKVEYTGNRGRASVTQEARAPDTGGNIQRTGLRANFALALAGGRFAWGRPVSDSFALVSTEKSLEGEIVQLNPQQTGASLVADRYEAENGWLGPAVSPELVSYRYSQLHIGTEKLPPGAAPIRENYVLLPTYKSGFFIPLGGVATVMAKGQLVDARGKPATLWSGEATREDGTATPITLFTNREGRFWLEGLSPGHYRLTGFGIGFDIPAAAAGIYDVGILKGRTQ